jgi:tRNA-splicing ligase RtcB
MKVRLLVLRNCATTLTLQPKVSIIPYAVGVDIACRMKMSVLDLPPAALADDKER